MQATRGTPLSGAVSDGTAATDHSKPQRRIGLLLVVATVVLGTDALTKAWAVAHLHHAVRLLDGALTLTLTRNAGAAFSIGTGATVVFTLIALGVIVSIGRTARRLRSRSWAVVLGLLLGGAAGNLGDRLFRAPGPLRGHVVDWIELPHWPVFNLADSAIVIGGILAVLLGLLGVGLEGRRAARGEGPGS